MQLFLYVFLIVCAIWISICILGCATELIALLFRDKDHPDYIP